jgi:hypothetical protein
VAGSDLLPARFFGRQDFAPTDGYFFLARREDVICPAARDSAS